MVTPAPHWPTSVGLIGAGAMGRAFAAGLARGGPRAFVVTDSQVSEDELKGWVKDNLARYKVPRDIVFLDELPRNATGKVLKRDLDAD